MDKEDILLQELDMLCGIGRIITSSLDLNNVFEKIMTLIGNYFNPRNWSLLLAEEGSERLYFKLVQGIDTQKLKDFYLLPGEGLAGWVYKNNSIVMVNDAQNDPRFCKKVDELLEFSTFSIIAVPIVNCKNIVIGVIELVNKIHKYNGNVENFTEKDMKILCTIASFTGIAIENAFFYEKIKNLALIDPLTGIYNRHYFNETLEREMEGIKRYRYSVCVVMMDVDGLKQINDIHGHLLGDKAISEIVNLIKPCIRSSDTFARFGGDEFVILMPRASKEQGMVLTERIQKKIDDWNNNPAISNIKLSISYGVYAANHTNAEELLNKADEALYRCKNHKKKIAEITSEDEMRHYLWEYVTTRKDD